MKNILVIVLVVIAVGFGAYFLIWSQPRNVEMTEDEGQGLTTSANQTSGEEQADTAPAINKEESIIGKSVEKTGRPKSLA